MAFQWPLRTRSACRAPTAARPSGRQVRNTPSHDQFVPSEARGIDGCAMLVNFRCIDAIIGHEGHGSFDVVKSRPGCLLT